MTEHTDDPVGGYERARDEGESGARSGGESQPRERTVPGTASAAEGYRPGWGTAGGEPLEGVAGANEEDGEEESEERGRG
ncbi:hypothetical protein QQY24_02175 [Streptomyces sp. TG1A-8]|uniref:hypothetical protein n=1 Tax=Streptomyces sp. TG1A-8 TaxID=3051385 RepID=UPI00265C07DF|nr:hypothetical protein [Streptomyces sp. TG1A-8]MDO0924274.1 hypothetical protein [Streptomyces sp. TG1A-8]